jgi:ATP-binding cassette subfamily B protein
MKDIIKIIKYSWSLKRFYIINIVLVVILSLFAQATPFFLKFLVDGLDKAKHPISPTPSYFVWLIIGILVVNLLTTILSNIQGYLGDRLASKLHTLLATRYYNHVLTLPLSFYDNEISGRITSRLDRGISTIANMMNAMTNNFLGFFLTAFATLIILAIYAWPIAILLAVLFPLYIWTTALSSRDWQAKQQVINQHLDVTQGRFTEAINQIRAVKAYVAETLEKTFFTGQRRSIEQLTRDQSIRWHWYDVSRRASLNIIFACIYGYVVYQTFKGRYSLGDFTLLIQLVTQAQFPLFASSFIVDSLQRASAGSRDFFAIMDTQATITDKPNAKPLRIEQASIKFDNVSFSYSQGAEVLHGISFEVAAGSKLALVGESGQGKSTIANLLCRFYEASSGQILIDGQNVADVSQSSLRSQIAVVFQEPALFSGTVRDNVTYGVSQASEAKITTAIEAANAGFVHELADGLETQIGERGVKLSGGQKQRLAIARAILKDAPILILDEATSALDSRAELQVQQALERLMHGRTTLIIAHRLSTIAHVDSIVCLEKGKISEQGTPTALAHSGGLYQQLLKLQSSNPTPEELQAYDLAA